MITCGPKDPRREADPEEEQAMDSLSTRDRLHNPSATSCGDWLICCLTLSADHSDPSHPQSPYGENHHQITKVGTQQRPEKLALWNRRAGKEADGSVIFYKLQTV